MKYSSDLEQAMQVVRKYDPQTFARMQAATWEVGTDVDVFHDMSTDDMLDVVSLMARSQAAGGTFPASLAHGSTDMRTLMVPAVLRMVADMTSVPVHVVTAHTLVHEFRHVSQTQQVSEANEREAFAASTQFAMLLPEPWSTTLRTLDARSVGHELETLRRQGVLAA